MRIENYKDSFLWLRLKELLPKFSKFIEIIKTKIYKKLKKKYDIFEI